MKKLALSAIAFATISSCAFAEVLASVNDYNITSNSVNEVLKGSGATYSSLPADKKKLVLDQLIDRRLLIDAASSDGIQQTAEFKQALQEVSGDLAVGIWEKKQLDSINVTDEEAKKFYDANLEKFKQPQMFVVRHILVKDEATAKKIIKDVSALPKAEQEKAFAEMAQKESIDPGSAQNGGLVGPFAEGQMVKEFYTGTKALKKGEMSKAPVKSPFGYHVIYLVEEKPAGTVSFAEAKEQIKQYLRGEKFRTMMADKIKAMRAKAKIEIK
jgi:peptidylprolyl isomerase